MMPMQWEKYVSGILVITLLVFAYPYIDTELATSNFTDSTLGNAVGVITPIILILGIVVLSIALLYLAVKDLGGR